MAFTKNHLEAIEKALSEGVLEVWFQDKKVRYHSVDEMLRVRRMIRTALGLNKRKKTVRSKFGKAL